MKNRFMILTINFLFLLLGSYVFYYYVIPFNTNEVKIKIGNSYIALNANRKRQISFSKIDSSPNAVITKSFTVVANNKNDQPLNYSVELIIDENTYNKGTITYKLTSDNTSKNGDIIPGINNQTVIDNSSINFGNGIFNKGKHNHKYILRLYYSGISDDNSLFKAHITINANDIREKNLAKNILENNEVIKPITNPGQHPSLDSEASLSSELDDYGTSYYFRGAVKNNYLVFANMCWRIVRIVGDGSSKIVLHNNNVNNDKNPCILSDPNAAFIDNTIFNNEEVTRSNAGVGFMYNKKNSSSYIDEHDTINNSNILNILNNWYKEKLADNEQNLADTIWCNDKSIDKRYGTSNGYGTSYTYYQAHKRLLPNTTAYPTFACQNDDKGGSLSKFTVSDNNGNGALTNKIGLLTADEIAFAGSTYSDKKNNSFYLYDNSYGSSWWSMSPSYFGPYNASMLIVSKDGRIASDKASNYKGVRPAISLPDNTLVIGSGTNKDPYIVIN